MTIGIIGGGASGMAAAIFAARSGAEVILFERQARVGRKLLATGNGRCNLTNIHACEGGYHGDDPSFADAAIQSFSPEETLSWFAQLGLLTVTEGSGRVYPYSDQANSVVDVLRFALQQENIHLKTGFEVEKVKKTGAGFSVCSRQEQICCDQVIIACGGLAGTALGGSMSGYKLLRAFGHSITRLRPTLVQVKSSWPALPGLKGVRCNCNASLLRDQEVVASSCGELQFTQYGLSGPVIFEISRDACQGKGDWVCRLDFLPQLHVQEVIDLLKQRRNTPLAAEDLLTGILHNRLGRVLVQAADIRLQSPTASISDGQLDALANLIKSFDVTLTDTMGMDHAQVTAGGACTAEFDPVTMESNLVPGLFACGEVLDIDGDCGGFNLQWAWSSGRAAGLAAGRGGV